MLSPTPDHNRRLAHPIEYDALQRRLWILGQRCHHGATGALLAGGGVVAAATALALKHRPPSGGRLAATLATAGAGTLLMVHDWHDRSMWFRLGPGM
jgi:hypothetical protein